jgi:predicted nuclease with RNAse H fold
LLSPIPIFVGIDVACAKRKRLPICVAGLNGRRLEPLDTPPEFIRECPLGPGNVEILKDDPFRITAANFVKALDRSARERSWNIVRIAVDAPAAPPATGERVSERDLRECGLSSFKTPDKKKWREIYQICRTHLRDGSLNRILYANKIWMLYGFEIFKALRARGGYEVIEVYPYAIVKTLLTAPPSKKTPDGYRCQLESVAAATNWTPIDLERALKRSVPGPNHDRLDAFMAAWVASLPKRRHRVYGKEDDPDDAIWVPR